MASVKARIIEALESGPASSSDIARRIGAHRKSTSAYLSILCKRGMVSVHEKAPHFRDQRGPQIITFWQLEK